MFFVINRTTGKNYPWQCKIWPLGESLKELASPGDTLELVELETSKRSYRSVSHVRETVYTFGTERVNATGDGYVSAREKAAQWLAQEVSPVPGLILPTPRCETCLVKTVSQPDLRSVADTGLCWSCRTPKFAQNK